MNMGVVETTYSFITLRGMLIPEHVSHSIQEWNARAIEIS
jgi:hypothetical protein